MLSAVLLFGCLLTADTETIIGLCEDGTLCRINADTGMASDVGVVSRRSLFLPMNPPPSPVVMLVVFDLVLGILHADVTLCNRRCTLTTALGVWQQ